MSIMNKSETILKVDNLSKKFHLKRNALGRQFPKGESDDFYALKNVSFEIKRGEICGTASVIDIGTGMHRDLSGYENIFLAGELLGMKKEEIKAHLLEIIAFSELEQFIHLPVKHYSSGMFMRLAFSVITHLDADILLIDEIIGVGDLAFSEKTTKKIIDLCKQGRSAIIATHSLSLIKSCCTNAIYMKRGVVVEKGTVEVIENKYLEDVLENTSLIPTANEGSSETKAFKPKLKFDRNESNEGMSSDVDIAYAEISSNGDNSLDFSVREQLKFEIQIDVKADKPFIISLHINHHYNQPALCLTPEVSQTKNLKPGKVHLNTTIPPNILNQGLYTASIFIVDNDNNLISACENVLIFKMALDDHTRDTFAYQGKFSGPIFIGGNWTM
jgi:lipopolysaccharide transport system ATP-binding protein